MKEGWTYKKLGEVARVQNGYAFDSKLFNENGNGTPLIRIRDIKRNQTYTYTTEDCSKEFYIENGDLLIGMDGDFNVCTWEGGHALLNQRVCHVVPSNQVVARFLYYLLPFPLKRINDKTTFATVKHLSSKQVGNILMPVPDIDEQKRIVERLDSAFENIDGLKANAEKQLAEARTLFQKCLAKAMEPKEGWEEKKFKELCTFVRGPFGGSLTKSCFVPSGYAVYEQQNAIYNRFIFRYFINEEKFKSMIRFAVKPGDLIMSCSGTIGKVAIVPEGAQEGIINQALLKLTPKSVLDKYYLKYLMESSFFDDLIAKYSDGAAIKNIASVAILKEIQLSIPPLTVQQRIVERLDSLSENVRKYEEIQRQIISECDALKQALLRKVFE